ncbi:MAG: LPS export ABC transporter permease LptF [Pseudomonadota bacterium]
MIILRYLSRELLQTSLAVTLVLLIIIMSGRFVKYLAEAAAGKFDPSVLLLIMFYRLPGFLELITPLGFMVAILMAYGRLYADSEMTVLFSCGLSHRRLLGFTYVAGFIVAAVVGACSLWLTPLGLQKAEQIIEQQKNRNELELLKPGRFQPSADGKLISYIEAQGERATLNGVFIASMGVAAADDLITVRADTAEPINSDEFKQRYLLLKDGVRYQGRPGDTDYRITHFEGFAQYIPAPQSVSLTSNKADFIATTELFKQPSLDAQLALQWRLSMPVLVLVITLLGVTMSYTSPRRGRYVMLFPSILLYLMYLVSLNAVRGAIEDQSITSLATIWLVHLLFLLLSLAVFLTRTGTLKRLFYKPTMATGRQ